MRYLSAVTLCLLLVSCTPESPVAPTLAPDTPSSTAEPQPTVDVSRLPSPSGWSPRPQQPGDGESEIPWADQRDVGELLAILESYACLEAGALPKPASATEGAYDLPTGEPAVLEALEFPSADRAEKFADAYLSGSLGCGATRLGGDALLRDIDGQMWTEVVLVDGSSLILATIQGELVAAEVDTLLDTLKNR